MTTGLKVIFLTSRFPYPLEKGDKLRAYELLRHLGIACEIHLIALCERSPSSEHLASVTPYVNSLHYLIIPKWKRYLSILLGLFNGYPTQVNYFYNRKAHKSIKSILSGQEYNLIYAHLARTYRYFSSKEKDTIVDLMDAFSEIARTRAEGASWWCEKWFWKRESSAMTRLEKEIISKCLGTTIISTAERNRLPEVQDAEIGVVHNGVSIDFVPNDLVKKEYDIVFVGNLSYSPNIWAAKYLVNEILPLLRLRHSNVKVAIAGANPGPEITALECDHVHVLGWVDDIREAYWSARMSVVPMFAGSGMQNKVLESLACGVPCITTSRVAEVFAPHLSRCLITCDFVEEFVAEISNLLETPSRLHEISANGTDIVRNNYRWDSSKQNLLEYICKRIK